MPVIITYVIRQLERNTSKVLRLEYGTSRNANKHVKMLQCAGVSHFTKRDGVATLVRPVLSRSGMARLIP